MAYCLSHISTENFQNRLMHVQAIQRPTSVSLFETQCINYILSRTVVVTQHMDIHECRMMQTKCTAKPND